jgi:hypothetical protein
MTFSFDKTLSHKDKELFRRRRNQGSVAPFGSVASVKILHIYASFIKPKKTYIIEYL